MPAHVGADSLKKPHHIVTLPFSEVVKDHAKLCRILALNYFEYLLQLPFGFEHFLLLSDNDAPILFWIKTVLNSLSLT